MSRSILWFGSLESAFTITGMSSTVYSIISLGNDGIIADIECHLSNNLPAIVIVGFTNRAVDEAKERIRGAFANSGLQLPRKRITVNLAPADIPKDGSSFDLAIAAAIMSASSQLPHHFTPDEALLGELGLDGNVRPVRGIIGKILAGRRLGVQNFYIPTANLAQAQLIPDVALYPVSSLAGLYQHFYASTLITPVITGDGIFEPEQKPSNMPSEHVIRLDDIIGQSHAKRGLIIAAAGGHNLLLNGPPGTGKSMLARTLPHLMPTLSHEEMLEVTHIHSLAGHDYSQIIHQRPFRAPHHTATQAAIIGGGQTLRPGEISLAHRGVLFFDELPEFSRLTLEALRQPLEDRIITVARAKNNVEYPANFILVATANPCPCGYYGSSRQCRCPPYLIQRYQLRVSGPILDRVDLHTDVKEVDHARLLGRCRDDSEHRAAIACILSARDRQRHRFGTSSLLNGAMTNRDIEQCAKLAPAAKDLLDTAALRLDLSARAYMRSVKVARTIADIDGKDAILELHVAEALQYRQPVMPHQY